ncbi:transposase [Pseudonocardia hierapolitana]|uniref:transposase n=1 Tax=Pseudonocardia hierapolitana TaxID=1128676 RepID=UPI001FE9AED8|nr:transposase [Pseudonocardia hierapolitana]
MRWRTRAGTPWRDVPERYESWQSVYGLFRRWQRDGIWPRILTHLAGTEPGRGHPLRQAGPALRSHPDRRRRHLAPPISTR